MKFPKLKELSIDMTPESVLKLNKDVQLMFKKTETPINVVDSIKALEKMDNIVDRLAQLERIKRKISMFETMPVEIDPKILEMYNRMKTTRDSPPVEAPVILKKKKVRSR